MAEYTNVKKYNLYLEENGSINIGKGRSPELIFEILKKFNLHKQTEEVLCAIALSSKGDAIGYFEIARGSISMTATSGREIMKRLILANASSFVIAHNHPSGDVTPSKPDRDFVRVLLEVSNYLSIEMMDSIIIGVGETPRYFSFRERGLLYA